MTIVCYGGCAIALLCALLVISARNAMHALLYLILMLLALALVFFALGAPFAAALQVIVYAGAIMVLFVFVVMMLNPAAPGERERVWLASALGVIPLVLAAALLGLALYALSGFWSEGIAMNVVGPKQVGVALYREYVLGVEIVSLVLLAGLIAAFHLAPVPRSEVQPAEESDHE
ncbi:MAG: NADH-quinone oxidoreductase subunit J [Armatimonadota bacterium]